MKLNRKMARRQSILVIMQNFYGLFTFAKFYKRLSRNPHRDLTQEVSKPKVAIVQGHYYNFAFASILHFSQQPMRFLDARHTAGINVYSPSYHSYTLNLTIVTTLALLYISLIRPTMLRNLLLSSRLRILTSPFPQIKNCATSHSNGSVQPGSSVHAPNQHFQHRVTTHQTVRK